MASKDAPWDLAEEEFLSQISPEMLHNLRQLVQRGAHGLSPPGERGTRAGSAAATTPGHSVSAVVAPELDSPRWDLCTRAEELANFGIFAVPLGGCPYAAWRRGVKLLGSHTQARVRQAERQYEKMYYEGSLALAEDVLELHCDLRMALFPVGVPAQDLAAVQHECAMPVLHAYHLAVMSLLHLGHPSEALALAQRCLLDWRTEPYSAVSLIVALQQVGHHVAALELSKRMHDRLGTTKECSDPTRAQRVMQPAMVKALAAAHGKMTGTATPPHSAWDPDEDDTQMLVVAAMGLFEMPGITDNVVGVRTLRYLRKCAQNGVASSDPVLTAYPSKACVCWWVPEAAVHILPEVEVYLPQDIYRLGLVCQGSGTPLERFRGLLRETPGLLWSVALYWGATGTTGVAEWDSIFANLVESCHRDKAEAYIARWRKDKSSLEPSYGSFQEMAFYFPTLPPTQADSPDLAVPEYTRLLRAPRQASLKPSHSPARQSACGAEVGEAPATPGKVLDQFGNLDGPHGNSAHVDGDASLQGVRQRFLSSNVLRASHLGGLSRVTGGFFASKACFEGLPSLD